MQVILQITIVFAIVALGESIWSGRSRPVKLSCARCKLGTKCVTKFGFPICIPVKLSCANVRCKSGTICVVKYGFPNCIPVNQCSRVKCPTGTKCVIKNEKPYCQPAICSLPAETGLCRAYFTRYFYNTTSAKCEAFVYGGCGENKNNFVKKEDCKAQCDDPGQCPPNKPQHYCLIRPCDNAKCPAHPGAKCVDNYCGGCNADFYVGGIKVDCACPPPLLIHHCKVAPCDLVPKCPAYPNAKCVNNYCGGCFADFYLNGRKVNCKKLTPSNPCAFSICHPGFKCVVENGKGKCVLDIILPASCAAFLCRIGHKCVVRDGKATCEPACKSNSDCKQQGSFCNTATGVCECQRFCPLVFLPVCGSDGKQYGNQCELSRTACEKKSTITTVPCINGPCARDKPFVKAKCFVEPCKYARCDAYPKAECKNNYCGGCNAEFYVGGKKVDCKLRSKRERIY